MKSTENLAKQDADWVDQAFTKHYPNDGYLRTGAYEGIQHERERISELLSQKNIGGRLLPDTLMALRRYLGLPSVYPEPSEKEEAV
jgi:hypothetical protein